MYSDRIKTLRLNKGLTQGDLGKYLDVSASAIYKWETGKAQPDINSITKMCQLFDVSSDFLIGNEGNTPDDADIKFAVFGDPDVTDAQFEEIKKIARIIRERDKK
jgi:transcriptional regulator with XRE-family HTH domain